MHRCVLAVAPAVLAEAVVVPDSASHLVLAVVIISEHELVPSAVLVLEAVAPVVSPVALALVRVPTDVPDPVAGPRLLAEVPVAPYRCPCCAVLARVLLIAYDELSGSGLGPKEQLSTPAIAMPDNVAMVVVFECSSTS